MRGRVGGAVAAAVTVALAGCWPAPGQGPDRQGYNPYEAGLTLDNVATLGVEWDVPIGARNIVAADGVIVANTATTITAFDLATGATRWTRTPRGGSPGSFTEAVIEGGMAYLPDVFLGTVTGVWDLQTGEDAGEAEIGRVVAFRGGDTLIDNAVPDTSALTGTWSFRVEDETGASWGGVTHVQPAFAVEDVHSTLGVDRVFTSGYGLMSATAGDGSSGVGVRAFGPEQPATCGPVANPVYACPLWVTPLDGTQATPVVLGPGGSTLYVATNAGTVSALDAATGDVVWTAALGAPIAAPPALAEGSLYVPLSTGDVQVLSTGGCGAPTCSPAWTATTTGGVRSQPAVAGGVVYVGSDTGTLLGFDAAGCGAATCAPVWGFEMGSPVTSAPIVTGGRLIVGARQRLVSFRPTPPPATGGP